MRFPISSALLILLFSFVALAQTKQSDTKSNRELSDKAKVKVVATVIGWSPFAQLQIVVGRSTSYFVDDVLIRVEQGGSGFKRGQYLYFRHDNLAGALKLPYEKFRKHRLWEFQLSRNYDCDRTLDDILYSEIEGQRKESLTRTRWADMSDAPLNSLVLCYALLSDGYMKHAE